MVFKEFLEQDFDHYDSSMVEVDYLGGGFPRVVLVDENNNNLKTYDISKLTRDKIRSVFKALKIKLVKPLRPLHDLDSSKVKGFFIQKSKFESLIFRKKIVLERPRLKKSKNKKTELLLKNYKCCLLYTSPSPRDLSTSRMPSSA